MSTDSGSERGTARVPVKAQSSVVANATSPLLHPRSFKLRFAPHREPGRSYISPTKPLALPATVTGKFYTRIEPTQVGKESEERALHIIQNKFEQGPREKYSSPATSAHEYGWWWEALRNMEPCARGDRRLHRPIRDSAWLKMQARLQAP